MTLPSPTFLTMIAVAALSGSAAAQPKLARWPAKRPSIAAKQTSRTLGARQEQRSAPEVSVTEEAPGPDATPHITIRVLGDPPSGKGRKPTRTAQTASKPTIRVTIAGSRMPAAPLVLRPVVDQPGHVTNED